MTEDTKPTEDICLKTESPVAADEQSFFEGTEKLLEIWFESSDPDRSLRLIPRKALDEICKLACCEIISATHNDRMSAYVLSESSLFVSDQRLILKTCGTTRPLDALPRLLDLAREYCKQTKILNIFYSRKNFVRPDLQCDLHSNIDTECRFLDQFVQSESEVSSFPKSEDPQIRVQKISVKNKKNNSQTLCQDGTAYCLGGLRTDRWYLYTMNPPLTPLGAGVEDHTLEVLMQELDQNVMDIFNMQTCNTGAEATKLSGIDKLMPRGTIIDDKLFEPCGYSMNGLIGQTDEYVTIHVTPEPAFSYVSFETNQTQSCLFSQLCGVLAVFRPTRFLMSVCANHASVAGRRAQDSLWNRQLPGYVRCDLQMVMTTEYAVIYARYTAKQDTNGHEQLLALSDLSD